MFHRRTLFIFALITISSSMACADDAVPSAEQVLDGLQAVYRRTAQPDGSFAPGVDPHYQGMSAAVIRVTSSEPEEPVVL